MIIVILNFIYYFFNIICFNLKTRLHLRSLAFLDQRFFFFHYVPIFRIYKKIHILDANAGQDIAFCQNQSTVRTVYMISIIVSAAFSLFWSSKTFRTMYSIRTFLKNIYMRLTGHRTLIPENYADLKEDNSLACLCFVKVILFFYSSILSEASFRVKKFYLKNNFNINFFEPLIYLFNFFEDWSMI